MATRALAVGERMHHLRIFFSNKFVYAQVMRKTDGHILAAASTNEKVMREALPNLADKNAAAHVGRTIAARCEAASIPKPRGKRFHGKLKLLIDNMRDAGMKFNYSTMAGAAAQQQPR